MGSLYTFITICKLNNINPEEYLNEIMMLLAVRPENSDVSDLLPVNWYRKNNGGKDPAHTLLYPSKH